MLPIMLLAAKDLPKTYGITDEWRRRVISQLERDGRGSHSRLARAIGISTGQLTEILAPESVNSRYVADINKHFGWGAPGLPIVSQDRQEIDYLIDGIGNDALDFLRRLKDLDPERRKALLLLLPAPANDKSSSDK